VAAKIVGVLFLFAGYALFRRARKTRTSSGGNRRSNPVKLQFAGARHVLGAIVCFIAAYLCLLNSTAHAW
jgi:hypothetical protein